jgi:DNA (cytosine-5)-methyltransferase 1
MSRNGKGKLLQGIRNGIKPPLDARNQLILPVIDIVKALQPNVVVLENVPAMENTIIEVNNKFTAIITHLKLSLEENYVGHSEVVDFADYGIPQRRKRLITIFTKSSLLKTYFNTNKSFLPPKTHSEFGANLQKHKTVRDTISNVPVLDTRTTRLANSNIPFHRVPLLDAKKYFWVSNTPPEKGAFDNQCVECGYQDNPVHGTIKSIDGINQSSKTTPVYCLNCESLLPRPWVEKNGNYRIMSGFTSAYKRMAWDKPASTLTKNLQYACSDHKLHPDQNRVLSLHEAFLLHTINKFDFEWKRANHKTISDSFIADIIGESVPPEGLLIIFNHIVSLYQGQKTVQFYNYLPLFSKAI